MNEAQLASLKARGIRIRGDDSPPKRSKYGNTKQAADGVVYDSQKEAKRHQELMMLERAGEISDLSLQVAFELVPAVMLDGRKKPSIRYVADFTYKANGILIVEDVKSAITKKNPVYRIKKHLMKSVHGIDIKET